MEIIWKHPGATADLVREKLAPERTLKESTVRTLLSRLEDKGHLTHKVDGRTYRYDAVEAPQTLALRAVRQIIDRFCAGSAEQLVSGMVAKEIIDAETLKRLMEQIEKEEGDKK